MSSSCSSCGGTDFFTNDSTAETFCTACGTVVNSNVFVEALSFSNSAMTGQIIGVNEKIAAARGTGVENQSLSRTVTLEKGFASIHGIAEQLGLSQQIIQGAQRLYALALNQKATKGKRNYISTACLYATCRRDNRPFMLIDFADVVEIPVRALGQTFMKFARKLKLDIPTIDPSLYLERFASRIPMIADNYREVSYSALRIVQLMNREWITLGRRPSGIVGSALIIACRLHNFKINAEDIASIVRLSPATINKRIREVLNSSLMALDFDSFLESNIDSLENNKYPPREYEVMNKRRKKIWQSLHERIKAIDDTEFCSMIANEESNAHKGESSAQMSLGSAESDNEKENILALNEEERPISIVNTSSPTDTGVHQASAHGSDTSLMDGKPQDKSLLDGLNLEDFFEDTTVGDTLLDNIDLKDLFGGEGIQMSNSLMPSAQSMEEFAHIQSIDISVANESYFQYMILDKQQKRAKAIVWDELTKEILPQLIQRREERKMKERCHVKKAGVASKDGEEYIEKLTRGQRSLYDELFST